MTNPAPQHRWSALRRIAVVIAVLIPLIPIIVAATSTGGGGPSGSAQAASPFTPVTSGAPAGQPRSRPSLPPGHGALVALVVRRTTMRRTPDGRALAVLGTRTTFGSPAALWVRRRSGRWLGVVSTQAGNNRIGWIPASAVTLSRVDWQIQVSLSARRITIRHHGRAVERYPVAIGAPGSPTPTGRFAVTDRLRTGDPAGPYGCCILALSAVAPHAIQGWAGGNRIAIHSTPETWSIGLPVSHGCIRLTLAEGRWLLAHIPLGTPTLISG